MPCTQWSGNWQQMASFSRHLSGECIQSAVHLRVAATHVRSHVAHSPSLPLWLGAGESLGRGGDGEPLGLYDSLGWSDEPLGMYDDADDSTSELRAAAANAAMATTIATTMVLFIFCAC
jgi:hypothetical protein